MKQTEIASFLSVIKTAYPFFEITVPVTRLWNQMLHDMDNEVAQNRLVEHIRTSKYAPTIADIVNQDKPQQSYYELLQTEERAYALELEEYNEQAVPMPDHIKERLNLLSQSKREMPNES